MNIIKQKIAPAEAGIRLDRWLKLHFPTISFGQIQKLIRSGQLRVDGKRAQASLNLAEEQEVRFPLFSSHTKETISFKEKVDEKAPTAEDVDLFRNAIVFEDKDYLVINKPRGIAVQGGTNTTLHLDAILKSLWPNPSERPRIVHRLDRDTTGILVFGRNVEAARWLAHAFRERVVQKRYLAIVAGQFPKSQGMIDAPMMKMGGPQKEKMTVTDVGGDPAQTKYRVLRENGAEKPLSYVEFQPLTGRTHQIRVHASYMGCPILGDGKYGGKEAHPFRTRTSVCLHAASISFKGPGGHEYKFDAPLPAHFQEILDRLFQGTR